MLVNKDYQNGPSSFLFLCQDTQEKEKKRKINERVTLRKENSGSLKTTW